MHCGDEFGCNCVAENEVWPSGRDFVVDSRDGVESAADNDDLWIEHIDDDRGRSSEPINPSLHQFRIWMQARNLGCGHRLPAVIDPLCLKRGAREPCLQAALVAAPTRLALELIASWPRQWNMTPLARDTIDARYESVSNHNATPNACPQNDAKDGACAGSSAIEGF
jgi:hypothetical protein